MLGIKREKGTGSGGGGQGGSKRSKSDMQPFEVQVANLQPPISKAAYIDLFVAATYDVGMRRSRNMTLSQIPTWATRFRVPKPERETGIVMCTRPGTRLALSTQYHDCPLPLLQPFIAIVLLA